MDKEVSQSFGKQIWQARRKKGLSQRELAAKVGVDYTYLSKLENDRVDPSEKVIGLLAEYLGLNAEELMYLAGRITQRDSEAFEELLKANYKDMPALFRRVRENPGIDSLVDTTDEQILRLQRENAALKTKISELEKQLQTYRFYSKEEIERSANELLKRMQAMPKYAPEWPFDATRVADFLDLGISHAQILPDDEGPITAKILPLQRQIVLNKYISELQGEYEQFTIAHQIGHWVLHINQEEANSLGKQLSHIGSEETLQLFLCCNTCVQLEQNLASSQLDKIEWQAQYFASCLLMPQPILEQKRKGRDLTNWRHLYAMRDELGVTISNLINRLQDIGWIYIPKGSRQIYLGKAVLNEQKST